MPQAVDPSSLPRSLKTFLLVSAALTLVCLGTELFCHLFLHLAAIYSWPLTPVDEFCYDLNGFAPKFARFHHPDFFAIEPQYAFAYPAPMAIVYWLLYLVPGASTALYFLILSLTLCTGVLGLGRTMLRHGLALRPVALFLAALIALSYPLAFMSKQGNLELFVWIPLALGTWLSLRGRGYSSAACFAIAGSLKIFPLIFLGLHIARRRWRPLIFGLGLAPLLTLVSLWLLGPDVGYTYRHIQDGLDLFQRLIVLAVVPREIGFDHSLFSLVKRLSLAVAPAMSLRTTLRVYLAAAAITGTVLFFVRIRRMPAVNQVLTLCVCAVLLPPASYDYTLILLYLPLALLIPLSIDAGNSKRQTPGLTPILVLLAASLAPMSEFILHGVRFGGQLRAVVLLALFVLALLYPLPSRFDPPKN